MVAETAERSQLDPQLGGRDTHAHAHAHKHTPTFWHLKAFYPPTHPGTDLLEQGQTCKSFLNSSTNWGSVHQIHEPLGGILV